MNSFRYAFSAIEEISRVHGRGRAHARARDWGEPAIYTVVHAVLLAPLPYPDADRIMSLQSDNVSENLINQGFAPAGFRELEKQVTTFKYLAASRYNYDNLTGVEKPTSLTGSLVTQDYFRVLGESALIGRTFSREDAAANASRTVILSYPLWQKQFGGRREIVGETIMLDDVPHEVMVVTARLQGTF